VYHICNDEFCETCHRDQYEPFPDGGQPRRVRRRVVAVQPGTLNVFRLVMAGREDKLRKAREARKVS
jgi:hypothetical protein